MDDNESNRERNAREYGQRRETVMLSCGQLKEGSLGHDQKNVHLGNMRVAKHLYQQGPQKEQQKVETKCGRSDRDLRGV